MNSRIYSGFVEHVRRTPEAHGFKTPVTFYAFDLNELEDLNESVRGFGLNRRAPLSLRESDYLSGDHPEFKGKLHSWIEKCDLDHRPDRITLVTSARWFGYVFNPVSFYLLQHEGALTGMIAEVNNTFGDRHVYAVPLELQDGLHQHRHEKEFHVSPFNTLEGEYQFTVRQDGEDLYIGVDLYRDGEKILDAWIEGTGRPLTTQEFT